MTLLTNASCTRFESLNPLKFNASAEAAVAAPDVSVFPAGLVAGKGEAFFAAACKQIEAKTYSELCTTMIANKCNKSTMHNYTQIYHLYLDAYRDRKMDVIEVGIGTPNQDVPSAMASNYSFGSSLRAWRAYMRNDATVIHGADVDPRVLFTEDRISTGYLNQLNPSSIKRFIDKEGLAETGIDFFLDDGLHEYRSNLTLLLSVWPYMKKNGLYLIEDMAANTYRHLITFLPTLSLGADCIGYELPSDIKSDNRIIVLQKV